MTSDDGIIHELRRASRAVVPAPDATAMVRAGLARKRRRRALTTVAGSVAGVALLGVGLGVALPGGTGPDRPLPQTPASPSVSTTTGSAEFTCPTGDEPQEAPPVPDLAAQERLVRQLATLDSVKVEYAAPTALGVVALVQDDSGDLDLRADPTVAARLQRAGVAHVYEWEPGASAVGLDADGQVRRVAGWVLDPAMRDVRRSVRGLAGSAGLAYWPEAGAIVVRWKAPVPEQVQELAGTRPDGVRVDVRPATYSSADVREAQRKLSTWLEETDRRSQWSSAAACADGSGLAVGMVPRVADEPGLAEEIADAVGMPVHVVPEDRSVERVG